ncbi:MAG TPA: hypothetical protein VMV79_05790, partial [Alphaproteobacteria bacterium]|nr:hypothetical protein [Alphaproteobacteria bacterium]
MIARRTFFYVVAAILLFAALETMLIVFIDEPLARHIRLLSPALIDVFKVYTNLGEAAWYLWPSGLGAIGCFAAARYGNFTPPARERALDGGRKLGFFFLCVALSGILTDIVKPLIGRAR